MSNDGKYYWIKLNTDFLRPDGPMDILMSQDNGSQYVMIYLMLCLNTANTNGCMFAKYGEMIIPYTPEKIARDLRYFSIDTVRVALEMFKQLGLVFVNTNNIMQIAEYEQMVGSETKWAGYKRKQRAIPEKNVEEIGQCPTPLLDIVQQEIRDKRLDNRDIDIIDNINSKENVGSEQSAPTPTITITLNDKSEYPIFEKDIKEWSELYPAVDVLQELRKMKGWSNANPTKRKTKRGIKAFINRWLSSEQDKSHKTPKETKTVKKNQFNNFHQRDYGDDDELERLLLNTQPK